MWTMVSFYANVFATALIDKLFREFDIVSSKNKCYYGCNVCLTLLTIVTFMGMIV